MGPRKSFTFFFCFWNISVMAWIFDGTISIPSWLTIEPNNFSEVTLNTHLSGLSLRPCVLSCSKIFFRSTRWIFFSHGYGYHVINNLHFFMIHSMESSAIALWYMARHFSDHMAWLCSKKCLKEWWMRSFLVLWSHSNLTITRDTVHEREQGWPTMLTPKDINMRQREIIFGAHLV